MKKVFFVFTAIVSMVMTSCNSDYELCVYPDAYTVLVNETMQMHVESSDKVTWSSSDNSVATVDAKGLVTAHKAGVVEIIASAAGSSMSCKITVVDHVDVDVAFLLTTDVTKYADFTLHFSMPDGSVDSFAVKASDYEVLSQAKFPSLYESAVDLMRLNDLSVNDQQVLLAKTMVYHKTLSAKALGSASMIVKYNLHGPADPTDPETADILFGYQFSQIGHVNVGYYGGVDYNTGEGVLTNLNNWLGIITSDSTHFDVKMIR